MDWNEAVEMNREALKRILATLVAMAGLACRVSCGGQLPFFPQEGAEHQGLAQAEKSTLSPALTPSLRACGDATPSLRACGDATPSLRACGDAATLPRRLHSAVLRLLRPAEAAARRLVIVVAQSATPQAREMGNPVKLPPMRPSKPTLASVATTLRSLGIAVVLSPADLARAAKAKRAAAARAARPRTYCLPLLDPLRRPFRRRVQYVPAHAAPCIRSFLGDSRPAPVPPPPSPDDPLDATRLGLRLQALGRVLDDLPGQARRFARWKARRDAALAQERKHDASRAAAGAQDGSTAEGTPSVSPNAQTGAHAAHRRIWPLRRGRPPGGRLSRYEPGAARRRNIREVDEVLAHAHALAVYALERRDTS